MKMDDAQQKIISFVKEQLAQAEYRAKGFVFDAKGKRNPNRSAYLKLKMHFDNFMAGKQALRWILFPGLRGAGKTTLLSQLYYDIRRGDIYKLFLSINEVTDILGSNLIEVISAFEEIISKPLERLDRPLILFLDEVQYDPDWASVLRIIYDRSPNVFILATGSSALAINDNPDAARRARFEKLFPMCFTEYMKIKEEKFEIKGLASSLRNSIFSASNAKEAHNNLAKLQPQVNEYWLGIQKQEIKNYMEYGSLPYMLKIENEALIYTQIYQTVDKIIAKDIPQVGKVDANVLSKVQALLYYVSESDTINVKKLALAMDVGRPTLANLLETLQRTELLHRIFPYGSHPNQVKKPSKYLFASPAFRSMYFHTLGSITKEKNYRGRLMEDTVACYMHRIFCDQSNISFTYDSAQGGADFILGLSDDRLVIEVGYGKKDYRQIISTMGKVKARYGICISSNNLELRPDINAISLPYSFFLLM